MASTKASPTARKLLQKLAPLLASTATTTSTASVSESQQTIASWMIFNRKKKDALSEGMSLAIQDVGGDEKRAEKFLVLLKIVHCVLISNCPCESNPDANMWEKSSPLRQALVEILPNLLGEIASCVNEGSPHIAQVEEMMGAWKENNVCDGFDWEGLRVKWEDGLKKGGEDAVDDTAEVKGSNNAVEFSAEKSAEDKVDAEVETNEQNEDSMIEKKTSFEGTPTPATDEVEEAAGTTEDDSPETKEDDSSSPDVNRKFLRQDSTMSVASVASVGEIDHEGVEEAHVEPFRLLEASKIIAQLQITRDMGGDTAMNISSALGHVSPDVEEVCQAMMQQQQSNEEDAGNPQHTEVLSKLPDDFLDLDIKYARQSLQTYKEAIRQQKRARLQCLHLLLQSRCLFGSKNAANILFGKEKSDEEGNSGDDTNPNISLILNKLKRRKEALSDAMALEGLDVEEDAEEEKKLEKEEKDLVPLTWFDQENRATDGDGGGAPDCSDDEPAAKKQKS